VCRCGGGGGGGERQDYANWQRLFERRFGSHFAPARRCLLLLGNVAGDN